VAARAAVAVENVENFVLDGLSIDWPTYPVPDSWRLLRSRQQECSPVVYDGNTESIRTGARRVPFHAVWARGLRGGMIRVPGVTASEDGLDAVMTHDCSVTVRKEW
jgi:hypothetical protein